jgi:putative salt-induced outer membrane protein YdiY
MTKMIVFVCATVAAALLPAMVAAEDAPEPWQPTVPEGLPTDYDWIRLPSDEWLKGELLHMYDGTLEFDSDELGVLKFDFDDVKEIRSSRVVQVGFERREPAIGRLWLQDGTARVESEDGVVEFPSDEILTMIVGAPREINYWSFEVSVGGNIRSGNTDQVDYTGRLGAQRRTVRNRIGFDYLGNITEINSEETSNNHRATLGWDLFLNQRLYVNVASVEWYRDPFQNISHRWTVGAGLGYELVDTPRTSWNASAGPAWQSTKFVSVGEGEDDTSDSPAFYIGTRFDHEVTGDIDFYFDYNLYLTDEENGTYNHHLDTGISFDLIGDLDAEISWVWDRIQDPRPLEDGTVPEQDDYRLIFGLGWSF